MCLCIVAACSPLMSLPGVSLQVRVQKRWKPELVLSLSVPIEAADNADATAEQKMYLPFAHYFFLF